MSNSIELLVLVVLISLINNYNAVNGEFSFKKQKNLCGKLPLVETDGETDRHFFLIDKRQKAWHSKFFFSFKLYF